jgi:hypothetical protein
MTHMTFGYIVSISVFAIMPLSSPILAQTPLSPLIGPKADSVLDEIVVHGSKACLHPQNTADRGTTVDLGCLNDRLKLMSRNASVATNGLTGMDAAFQSTTAGAFTPASARMNSSFYQALGGRMPPARDFSNSGNWNAPKP